MRRAPALTLTAGVCAALLAGLVAACAQSDAVGPSQPAMEASLVLAPGFTKCRPLAAASAAKYVSPGVWDTLRVGPHRLIFQPNSLTQRTYITATVSADSSRSVKFGPEGLVFKSGYGPTLQMSVGNCSVLSSTMKIVYADDLLSTVKETRSSIVNLSLQTVTASIAHFSRYAVHY